MTTDDKRILKARIKDLKETIVRYSRYHQARAQVVELKKELSECELQLKG